MKLIDYYLDEVRQQLPLKNREDILREIQSTLMDMLEDRNSNPGQEPTSETVMTVLREFGSPQQVARQYSAQNFLIGPRMYPLYLQVLKIVLFIIGAFNLVGIIIAIVTQSGVNRGVFETLAQILGSLFSSLFTGFGIVTLSFASIERTTPKDWKFDLDQEWQPEQLLTTKDKQRVNIPGLAIEITLTLIFIAFLNLFLDRIGIYFLGDSGWVSTPILNNNFLPYIPWITAYAVLDIALNLYLIRKGVWDKLSVLAKLFINLFKIAVSFAIITGPAFITISPSALEALNLDQALSASGLSQILNTILKALIGLSIFGLVIDSGKRLYDAFIKGKDTRFEIDID